MNIHINDHRKIFSIQDEFSSLFPYLRMEFSDRMRSKEKVISVDHARLSNRTVGEIRTQHNQGDILITPFMKVLDLEQCFKNVYGLTVQIFRKSGRVWLETTLTDAWTLEEQNRQGEMLSKNVK
jgi:hypothetical protein